MEHFSVKKYCATNVEANATRLRIAGVSSSVDAAMTKVIRPSTQYCRRQPCSKCGDYQCRGSLVRKSVRDEPKSHAYCAFASVGPSLPCWRSNNPKCTNSSDQARVYSGLAEIDDPSSELEFENHLEFALSYGERYGWRSVHVLVGDRRDMAMVHGAIFNRRIQILMETRVTTNIMSLDLARRLKLKLRRGYRLRVTGVGDVPTYATAQARKKSTLGVRVVYVMDIWVGNIGAGVVRSPDEESLYLVGGPEFDHVGLEVVVSLAETVRLQPGRSMVLPVKYHQADPDKVTEWAGHGDQWVTQFIYGAGRRPKAVKVVNISDQVARITQHTVVACLVEKGHLPRGDRFVRPKAQKSREWSALIYEAEPSPEYLMLEEMVARQAELVGPPAVEKPTYQWPKKLLLRKKPSDQSNADAANSAEEGRMLPKPPRPPSSDSLTVSPSLPLIAAEAQGSRSEVGRAEGVSIGEGSEPDMESIRMTGGGSTSRRAQQELEGVFQDQPVHFVADPTLRRHDALAQCTELLSDLRNQLAAHPELRDLSPKADLSTANIEEPGITTAEMESQVRIILERHHSSFLGDGNANAVPTPARGVICDLVVGDANPVAQRSRPSRPEHLQKVHDLLKTLLETKLIEYLDSEWASPVVIVMKKNGVDIRLCIDYRLVNQLVKLMHYPLPLIDDLFESAIWFLSLDMATGFWAVPMTFRAKHISMLDNCLWGFVRLPASEESQVDAEVLGFLEINVGSSAEHDLTAMAENMTVFQRNIPAPPQLNPVLGRSSDIDDIAYGAETWEQMCEDLDRLLYRRKYWRISVSMPKSEFGKRTISYLSHEIGAEGIRAKPKIAKGVMNLQFPSTLKGVQSFLGSLNNYNKFIEDLPVIASVLNELTDAQIQAGRDLSRVKEAFEVLKRKIVSTPLLRHPDSQKPFVIVVHANPWAACAVLDQEHDRVILPVRFTGRVLHDQELRYHPAEKEVVALIRVLSVFYTTLAVTKLIKLLSFDGAAKLSDRRGSAGCILWKLSSWYVVEACGIHFEDATREDVEVAEEDNFDAEILPEDVDGPDEAHNEYEVERIRDVRRWKGYSELEWRPVSQLNCGALLYEFNKGAKAQARFRAMQAGDELPESEAQ
ncbi:hypothetical protein ON010_g13268 [Phytophthora cinnamomi]|nr:hypothetical protein ON010_g13268 [Phytophthora cinnamomi]